MALFDIFEGAFDFVGDIFGGIDARDIVQSATSLIGAKQTSDANREAAEIAARAQREAVQAQQEAAQREAVLIREGNTEALARLDALAAQSQPGQTALRQILAVDPSMLTSEQERSLDETRRTTVNALNTSGLRGSGRAVLSGLRGVESDFRTRSLDTNLRRRQDAANRLAGQNVGATTGAANILGRQGERLGSVEGRQGAVEGGALRTVGALEGGANVANASIRGQTLGDIAAIISSDEKDRRRSSRFAPRKKDEEANGAVGLGGRP